MVDINLMIYLLQINTSYFCLFEETHQRTDGWIAAQLDNKSCNFIDVFLFSEEVDLIYFL